jgi:hypothetical protein
LVCDVIYGRNHAGSSGFYPAPSVFVKTGHQGSEKNRLTNPNFILNLTKIFFEGESEGEPEGNPKGNHQGKRR